MERPAIVVDLGSGTGLSTRVWVGRAERVVGVEPDRGMRAYASARGGPEYVAGESGSTGLPDGCADLVTCSQSLHWMDPRPTFAEAARILRPGGVFAAYDYDPVPVVDPGVDAVFEAVLERAEERRRGEAVLAPWPTRHRIRKDEHLANMRVAGVFRHVRELVAHSVEEGDADRLLGYLASLGEVAMRGAEDIGLAELERVARRRLGDRAVPWWIGYRVRIGVR